MTVLYYGIEVLATIIEFYILFSLIELHEVPKYADRKQRLVKYALCLGMTAVVITMNQISLFSYYTIIVTIVCVMFLGKLLCRGTILQNFIISLIFIMVLNIIDFSILTLVTIIGPNKNFMQETSASVGMPRTLWIIGMKVILILLYILYKRFLLSFDRDKTKYLKWIVAIAVLGFLCVSFLINALLADTTTQMRESLIPGWIFMIGCLVVVGFLFRLLYANEKKKHTYELVEIQTKYLQDNYQALHKEQKEYAQNYHDFNNHLIALKSLISDGSYEKALAYIDKVQRPMNAVNSLMRTGVDIVDAILNTKEQLARDYGISIHIQADFPTNSNLEPADVCAILSNLLDNAIEACLKMPASQERFIRFSCGSNNNIFIIKVKNSVAQDPFDKNGKLPTTKENKKTHGLGLKSIASAAERYDGIATYSCKNNIFTAIITLFYNELPFADKKLPFADKI